MRTLSPYWGALKLAPTTSPTMLRSGGVMRDESRRQFLKISVAATFAALTGTVSEGLAMTSSPAVAAPIKKGILLDMLPANLSYADRLKLAREIGFEVLQ